MEEPVDEKKPFDTELQDEETQPDPDEQLMLEQGNGRVWLVKMPRYLLERWSAIDAEDVHLATIRVYPDALGPGGKKPRIVLFLPPDQARSQPPSQSSDSTRPATSINHSNPSSHSPSPSPPSSDGAEPDAYDLEMVQESVENQMVVAERPKDPSFGVVGGADVPTPVNTRARTTILTGRVKHDCNLRPLFTDSYRRQMRERSRKYNTPRRQIMRIEEAGISGGRGGINRLSSGVGVGAGNAFGDLIKSKPKPVKGTFERMARIPRNQLLDQLFSLYRTAPRWGIKTLREKTQQPEVYLKEVLGEIAMLHRSGEFNGLWELKDNFKDKIKMDGEGGSAVFGSLSDNQLEEDGEDGDDEDMEEVSPD